MAEEDNTPHDDDVEMPPVGDDGASMKEKKKPRITQGKIFGAGLACMALVVVYVLFFSGGDDARVPDSDETVSAGGADVEGDVASYNRNGESRRSADDDSGEAQEQDLVGGVGQERAEVLSEIDQREDMQRRVEAGQSAVRFGDPFDNGEEKEEPAEEAASREVFGDVEPRTVEEEANQGRTPPRVAPISGTTSPQYQRGGSQEASAQQPAQGPQINLAAVEHELGVMEASGEVNTAVNYHVAKNEVPRGARLAQAAVAEEEKTLEEEVLALPGDVTVAYLSNRISSDQPSALARVDILSGPLKGGRMLGSASFEGERLILTFKQLVYDGEVIEDVTAVAVDPDTLDSSVQDGVDRRLFTRYGVPILSGIASIGIDYQAERNSTNVTVTDMETGKTEKRRTNNTDSFGDYASTEAADGLKKPLQAIASNAASTPPEVWAKPGAIGLMFVTKVAR